MQAGNRQMVPVHVGLRFLADVCSALSCRCLLGTVFLIDSLFQQSATVEARVTGRRNAYRSVRLYKLKVGLGIGEKYILPIVVTQTLQPSSTQLS